MKYFQNILFVIYTVSITVFVIALLLIYFNINAFKPKPIFWAIILQINFILLINTIFCVVTHIFNKNYIGMTKLLFSIGYSLILVYLLLFDHLNFIGKALG